MSIELRKCESDEEMLATHGVISELYEIDEATYLSHLQEMLSVGEYTLLAVYDGDEVVGAVGYRIGRRLYCGKYLHVDNLVVKQDRRGEGISHAIIEHLKQAAKVAGCDTMLADSYIDNRRAQKIFMREGFYIRGFHMKFDSL